MRNLLFFLVFALVPTVFAVDVQMNSVASQNTTCNEGTFHQVYYVNSSNDGTEDIFDGASSNHWVMNQGPSFSWINERDPQNIFVAGPYSWFSEIKPMNVPEVIIWDSPSLSVGQPSSFVGLTRNSVVGQFVHHLSRTQYNAGPVMYPPTGTAPYTIPGQGTQATSLQLSINGQVYSGDECQNLHLAWCGDGIIDDNVANGTFSTDIFARLNGGELCDSGVNNTNIPPTPPYSLTPPPNTLSYCLINCSPAVVTGGYCGDGVLDILLPPPFQSETCGEFDNDGNLISCPSGQECQNCQCVNLPSTGYCSEINGAELYVQNLSSFALQYGPSYQTLCENSPPNPGPVGVEPYNPSIPGWDWECPGTNGGATGSGCFFVRRRCGDGLIQSGITYSNGVTAQESCESNADCSFGGFCHNCTCIANETNGVCASQYHNQRFYEGTGFLHTGLDLCDEGIVSGFVYSTTTNQWIWTCNGLGGGNDDNCSAQRLFCGDNQMNGPESCDPGDINNTECIAGEQCNNSCVCESIPVTPTCGYFNNQIIYNFDDTGNYYVNGQQYTTVPGVGFNNTTSGLCGGNSSVTGLLYNPLAHQREWYCQSIQNPSFLSSGCVIKEAWCGDGIAMPSTVIPYFSVPGYPFLSPGQLWEECEDANTINTDGCVTFTGANNNIPWCKRASCGDAILQPLGADGIQYTTDDEQCDDGNTIDSDACNNSCQIQTLKCISQSSCEMSTNANLPSCNTVADCYIPACGNGTIDAGEECNEPNLNCPSSYSCDTASCQCSYVSSCGNGVIDPGELCGEPGLSCLNGETCNTQTCECVYVPGCGNGTIDLGEECNEPGLTCVQGEVCDTTSCQCNYIPGCGNGTIDLGEECNEPGLSCPSGETCNTSLCECLYVPVCGNGTLDPGEECDDGNQNNNDSCTNQCQIQDLRCINTGTCTLSLNQNLPSCVSADDCITAVTFCGDGVIQTPNSSGQNEQCDDGSQNGIPCVPSYGTTCNYCTIACQLTGVIGPTCGDGIVQAPEECDLGTGNGAMSACSLMCKHNTCHPVLSDLVIQKELIQHTGTCANMTGDVVFKLSYSNVGSGTVSGVIVQDILPAGFSFVSYDSNPLLAPPTITMSGSLLTFFIGNLGAGQSGTIILYTKMMIGGICPPGLTNTATISVPVGDPTPYNNSSSVTIPCHNTSCDLLTVTPQSGVAPMTSQFVCQGMGSNYQIVIKNKFGATIHTIYAQTGSYSFQDIGSYSISCFVDGKTSSVCNKIVTVGGSCESLTTNVKDQSLVPFTGSLSCKGNGSQFEIQLFKDNILQKSWKQQGGSGLTVSHYFSEAGKYRSICFVDGVSHPVCSDPTAVSFSTQSLTDTLVNYQQQKSQASSINSSPSVIVSHTLDQKTSHISLDTLLQAQQQDVIDAFMKQKLAKLQATDIKPVPTTTPIIKQGVDFHTYIHKQIKQFNATQQFQCQDLCQLSFVLKAPVNTGYCGDAVVQKPNGSGFMELCDDGNQLTGDACLPNCTLPVGSGYCGDAIKQTPNSSGFNEQCDYGTTGNNGQVSINGSVCLPGCLLPSGGGGSSGGGNNYCGDGITRNGEECDNGMTGNNGISMINGLVCDSNCKKISGGSSNRGGDGSSSTSYCGNGIRESGEACDLGAKNGDASICTQQCRLKGFTPNDPKCEYIDPPSVQVGEPLPIWWNYEGGGDIVDGSCHTGTLGKIMQPSLMCHFSIKNPHNIEVDRFTRPCDGNDIDRNKWYPDFVNTLPVATRSLLQSSIGVTSRDTSKVNANSPFAIFGEYTVSLDKISYDICSSDGQGFVIRSDSFDDRVCQYNFALTTPYAIQKGVGLSSFADDKDILSKFYSLGGGKILEGVTFNPLVTKSSLDLASTLELLLSRYTTQATQQVVEATSIFKGMRKVPGQEIYVTDRNFVLDTRTPINNNKATVLLALGDISIRILGSLNSRMMILAPQGVITFENTNCDMTDTVEGVFIAGSFDTNTVKNTMESDTRCSGGGLVVNGLLIGGGEEGIKSLRDRRRSTLNNWFSSIEQRDQQIFDGASLRIQSNAKLWDGLPHMVSEVMKELRVTK